jgi:hypothetical protein
MTNVPENARIADEPIEVRREAEVTRQREIGDGLRCRHVAIAEEARNFAEVHFAHALRNGQALGMKLCGG